MLRRLQVVLSVALIATAGWSQVPDFYEPTAYRSIYLTFPQSNFYTLLQQNYASQTELPATMVVDGVSYPQVGVRFRGNTSYTQLPATSQKRSVNIRLDSLVPGQSIQGYSHLNLNNGYHDPTFLREFLTYWIMRRHGPAPKCNFVKLYMNNQYWGVYINVQQPNKDWAQQEFRSNDGNRYRCFPTSGSFSNGRCAFTFLGSTPSLYLAAYQSNQGDGTDLMLMCDILNNTPVAQIQTALPVIFNVDSFYRYIAVMNACTNDDSYIGSGKDHYLYHDDVYGDFHTFPFDVNEALAGSTNYSPWTNTTSTIRPGFSKTFVINEWRQRYVSHIRTVVEDSVNWAYLGPIVTQYHAMISADVSADTKKLYTFQQFQTNVTAPITTTVGGLFGGSVTIPGLQPLIQGRTTFLSGHVDLSAARPTLSNLQHSPANPNPGNSVTVTVQVTGAAQTVELWRRSAGPYARTAMFDDGMHNDGAANDGLFGVILPPSQPGTLVDYYAMASTSAGTLAFAPKTAEHNAPSYFVSWPTGTSPIKINEFLAINTSVIQDPAGEFEDYVELFNSDPALPIDVSGMYLTDDLVNSTKWQIPAGTIIPSLGTLLVWCDEDGTQGSLHANFKLSSLGESVGLFAADGITQFDSVDFGAQTANISTGRLFDGGAPRVTFPTPTPNALNAPAVCGYRSYSALIPGSHSMTLAGSGSPSIGTSPSIILSSSAALASLPALLIFSGGATADPFAGTGITVLVDLVNSPFLVPITLSAAGGYSLIAGLPQNPGLVGGRVYIQAATISGTTWHASNGLEVTICP